MPSILKEKMQGKLELKKHIVPFAIIVALSFVAMQVPFAGIWGSDKSFTLFDFLAPTFGAIWGGTVGMVSVLAVNLVNLVLVGDYSLSSLIRLLPIMFAIYHFAKRNRASSLIGLVGMALFIAHPVGRQAWQYSLYWLIPMATTIMAKDNVFAAALGTTFTQHAVGSVAFLYAYGFTPEFWKALVPVVAGERMILALGAAATYVSLRAAIKLVSRWVEVPGVVETEDLLTLR